MHEITVPPRRHNPGREAWSVIRVPNHPGARRRVAGGREVAGGDGRGLPGIRLEKIYAMVHRVFLDFPLSRFSLRVSLTFTLPQKSESISPSKY